MKGLEKNLNATTNGRTQRYSLEVKRNSVCVGIVQKILREEIKVHGVA